MQELLTCARLGDGRTALIIKRGSKGRIHLGFNPSRAQLPIAKHDVRVIPGRVVRFAATREGIATLFLNHGSDDVEYIARIRFSPWGQFRSGSPSGLRPGGRGW